MLHATFQDHKTFGSGVEDWSHMYGHGCHLGHVRPFFSIYVTSSKTYSHKIGFDWPSGFREEDA